MTPRSLETGAAALVALALLAVVLAVWRRRGGGVGNLIAGVVAVASLWLLYDPPVSQRQLAPRSAWLKTRGASGAEGARPAGVPDTRLPGRRLEVFSLPGAFLTNDAQAIPDVRWLLRHRPEVTRLRVSGHGLAAGEWSEELRLERLSDLPWQIDADPPPALGRGFAALTWTRELALGSELVVRGVLSGCPECAEVRLEGAGAGPDRGATAVPDAAGAFEVRVRPRAAGRFLVEIVAMDQTAAPVLRQTFDVVVDPPAPLAVLWLERAPSFESRAVRRWREGLEGGERAAKQAAPIDVDNSPAPEHAAAAHAVAAGVQASRGSFVLRSTWSRGRARTAVVGAPAASAPLDQRAFGNFDVVVADAESLRALGATETEALRQAVREGGLGLLLRLHGEDRLPASEPLWAGWRVRPIAGLDELLARVGWPGFEAAEPLLLAGRELQPEWGTTPLVTDQAGRILAGARPQGAGAVVVSLLEGTYRWTLAGDRDTHALVWSRLLGAVARPRATAWHLPTSPALVDWPFDLAFTAGRPVEEISCREPDGATAALPFQVPAAEPGRAVARFWPRLAGWHACAGTVAGELLKVEFFAHPVEPWSVWLDGRRHDATAVAAALTGARPLAAGEPVRRPVTLPRWPFYASFLVAVGYLWAAERWRGEVAGRLGHN